ncbi:MAG: BamA/TamA family outer membrane protein, partial [Actinomycetota bacterium]
TEPGSSSDRVVLNVDLEEKSTGDFSVSGGYSTSDGALAEVSISERNFLGRGLYAKAAVTYGQYSRGYSLSYVDPYLLDYRVALGLDLGPGRMRAIHDFLRLDNFAAGTLGSGLGGLTTLGILAASGAGSRQHELIELVAPTLGST